MAAVMQGVRIQAFAERTAAEWRDRLAGFSGSAKPNRAPDFNEHGDAILESLGLDWDTIIDLKVRGVVA